MNPWDNDAPVSAGAPGPWDKDQPAEPGMLQKAGNWLGERASRMGEGLAATFSGMGRNLSAGMQGSSPSTGDKRLVGEYALTDAGHDVKLPDGQYRRIDPSREVVLNDPVTKKTMVYERDVPADSISGRADAMGRVLGMGALSTAPMGTMASVPKAATAAQTMSESGVKLTPGQALGGIAQRVEDRATSIPIVGDMINRARRGGVESFNTATANKVLEPIGQTVDKGTKPGHAMIAEAGEKISKAYDDLLPSLTLKPDARLVKDIAEAKRKVDMLPKELRETFNRTINDRLVSRFENGAMDGKTLKQVESDLGQIATKFRGSADSFQRSVGEAVGDVQASIRSALARSNPDHAQTLRDINRAYAMQIRLENAGAAAGSKEGVFSPAALRAAVKAKDTSRNKRAFARGDALLQDFAEAGERTLGSTMPNSGTADRTLMALMAGGGLGYVEPTALGLMGAATLPYMPYARPLAVGLLNQRQALRQSLPGGLMQTDDAEALRRVRAR